MMAAMNTVHRISGDKIRAARIELGLNKADFARRLGVGWRAPLRWEAGTVQPSPHYLMRISEVTGKDVAWFYEESPADEPEAAPSWAALAKDGDLSAALTLIIEQMVDQRVGTRADA